MRAKIVRTEGYCLEAVAEIDGALYHVMDEVTSDQDGASESVGKAFDVKFTFLLDGDEGWEEVFSGNPDRRRGLERIDGWRYRAYGEVVSVDPVLVDCGVTKIDGAISTHDQRVIGAFVGFEITRLGVRAI